MKAFTRMAGRVDTSWSDDELATAHGEIDSVLATQQAVGDARPLPTIASATSALTQPALTTSSAITERAEVVNVDFYLLEVAQSSAFAPPLERTAFAAPVTTTTAEAEIAFLSGVTSSGTVAATSFGTWNYDSPATYGTTAYASKWGSGTPGTGGTVTYYFDTASNWTAAEKSVFLEATALWSAEVNLNFSEAASSAGASFTIDRGSDGSAYWSGWSTLASVGGTSVGVNQSGGLLSIDTSVAGFGPIDGSFTNYGGYALGTIVHELGHMLGLGHGGAYNGNVNEATQQFGIFDTLQYSLMSYISPTDTSAKYYASYTNGGTSWGSSLSSNGYYYSNTPTTPMMLDIAAAQRLYGARVGGPLSGGQTYGYNSNIDASIRDFFDFTKNTPAIVTLWNSGTGNTLDLSGATGGVATVDLNPGTFSSFNGKVNNLAIALGTQINSYVGSAGSDRVTGNNFGDTLYGSAGADTYTGGTGFDVLDYKSLSFGISTTLDASGTGTVTKIGNSTDTVSSINGIGGSGTSDTINSYGTLTVFSSGGSDIIGGLGASSNVTVDYSKMSGALSATFNNGTGTVTKSGGTDTLSSIAKIIGTDLADTFTVTGTLAVDGGAGDDTAIFTGGVARGFAMATNSIELMQWNEFGTTVYAQYYNTPLLANPALTTFISESIAASASTQVWSNYYSYYNANWLLERATQVNDTARVSPTVAKTTETVWDIANVQPWSTFTNNYDLQGRVISQSLYNDVGNPTPAIENFWDYTGGTPWKQFENRYALLNGSYAVTKQSLILDTIDQNPTATTVCIRETYFDWNNTQPTWNQWIREFNNAGTLLNEIFV